MKYKLLILFLLTSLFGLQYTFWWAETGWTALIALKQQNVQLLLQQRQQAARNAQLAAEIQQLKQGLDAVETHARRELNMIRDDEYWVPYPSVTPEL
jgi:cell division protein FtsB